MQRAISGCTVCFSTGRAQGELCMTVFGKFYETSATAVKHVGVLCNVDGLSVVGHLDFLFRFDSICLADCWTAIDPRGRCLAVVAR